MIVIGNKKEREKLKLKRCSRISVSSETYPKFEEEIKLLDPFLCRFHSSALISLLSKAITTVKIPPSKK